MRHRAAGCVLVLVALIPGSPAVADTIGFEPPSYTAGSPCSSLTGQGGWYKPPSVVSADASVCTYAALAQAGFAVDPSGGTQLAILHAGDDSQYPRGQYNLDFRQAAVWTLSYDLMAINLSPDASSKGSFNIGSFGLIQPAGSSFTAFDSWDSAAANSTWTTMYHAYNSSGTPFDAAPGAAWQGLLQDHWYRETTVVDVGSLSILSVAITDLSSGSTTTVTPAGWYLMPNAPPPGGIRLFGSGSTNVFGVDNIQLESVPVPEPGPSLLLLGSGLVGLAGAARRWRRK
jgi:hypothetical protein